MIELKKECGLTAEEREECRVIDAVLKIVPGAATDQIADLMTAGLSVKEIAAEIKAAPY